MKSQGRQLFIAIVCADILIVIAILVIRAVNSHGSININVVQNTSVPEAAPGVVVSGSVKDISERSVESVPIYAKYANYPGQLIAETDAAGNYKSEFLAVPGNETVTVWAERSGLQFQPPTCFWHHQVGYEMKACDFLAQPTIRIYLPIISKVFK